MFFAGSGDSFKKIWLSSANEAGNTPKSVKTCLNFGELAKSRIFPRYVENEKSNQSSAGDKKTGFSVLYQIFTNHFYTLQGGCHAAVHVHREAGELPLQVDFPSKR